MQLTVYESESSFKRNRSGAAITTGDGPGTAAVSNLTIEEEANAFQKRGAPPCYIMIDSRGRFV